MRRRGCRERITQRERYRFIKHLTARQLEEPSESREGSSGAAAATVRFRCVVPKTIGALATFLAEPPRQLDPEAAALVERILVARRDPSTLSGRAFLALHNGYVFDNVPAVNLPSYLEVEVAGANGTATARSVARMFALLAEGGELDGVRLVSQSSIRRFRTVQLIAPNALELEADPPAHLVQLHMRLLGYHGRVL
jgi:hypothetical protein